jgi:hypothetical protein
MRFKTLHLFCFTIFACLQTYGQEVKVELKNGRFEAEKIYEASSNSSADIYKGVLNWIAYTFRNTESVTQSKIENEMVLLQGISSSVVDGPMFYKYGLEYVIQIDIKEGKLRFRAYDIKLIGADAARTRASLESTLLKNNGEIRSGKQYISYKNDTDTEINKIYLSLTSSLNQKETKKDDW